MIDKYTQEFGEMYERILERGESPSEVFRDYAPVFEEEGVGHLRLANYLVRFIRERSKRKV